MIIHVERIFSAMTGEMCGEDLKKNLEKNKTLLKQHGIFFIPSERYKKFPIFLTKSKSLLNGQLSQ